MPVSPIEVEKCLKGVDYPAEKQDLMKCAKGNHASQEVIEVLKKLPEETYQKPTDVTKAISQVQ